MLGKSRLRDRLAIGYGTYHLVETSTNRMVAEGLDLAEIELSLNKCPGVRTTYSTN